MDTHRLHHYLQNPNPNPNGPLPFFDEAIKEFELSDYLLLDEDRGLEAYQPSQILSSSQYFTADELPSGAAPTNTDMQPIGAKENTCGGRGCRVAFRTKSHLEIMDDGFKWRKYGKKMVKNSPNPRNYYKCSSRGCNVKKRVERDVEDASYVITTYDGVHNHETPNCAVYYNHHRLLPHSFILSQPQSSSSQ